MRTLTIAVALVGAVALAGCQDAGPKLGDGTLIGTAGGGQPAATVPGVSIGAWLGSSLDQSDQMYAEQAYNRTFETARSGTQSSWRNPDSGHYGTVTPTRTYRDDGRDCREFTQTIYIRGQAQTGTGNACRNGDGTWRVVSS